jgi:hypothetical protein
MNFVQTYLKSPAGQSASKDITEMASKSIAKKLATKAAAAGVAAAL